VFIGYISHSVIPDIFNRESILIFLSQKPLVDCLTTYSVNSIFCGAVFRPGGRACCLARPEGRNLCCGGKGPKTIDALSGHIGEVGREP
jgi:hypothetical protein